MDTYSLLREIADSWVLLAMFVFFIGTAIWAFWPSQSNARRDASMIPFRNDEPAESGPKTRDDSSRNSNDLKLKEASNV